jgi:ribosomal protein L29
MGVVFDKLAFMRRLEVDGTFTRPQAEQLSEAFHQAVSESVATKQDIENLRAATKQDIESLRAATKQDIESLRAATKQDIENLRGEMATQGAELRGEMATLGAELRREMAELKVWIVVTGASLFGLLTAIRFLVK